MRERDNLAELAEKVNPDFTGFIFHPKSPRYFLDGTEEIPDEILPENRVGVFVNATKAEVLGLARMFQLNNIQLHGNETHEFCKAIIDEGFTVIKAFGIKEIEDFDQLGKYVKSCHYFLFDTKTNDYGGSGKKFNWAMIDQVKIQKPFFLSGGVDSVDVKEIKNLKNQPFAIDINSRFEINPGKKDIEKIKLFKQKLFIHA